METITYRTGEADASIVKQEMPLIKVSATNYSNDTRPVISSYRKLLCMNMKQPNVLRVLNRQGKYTDSTVKAAAVRHLCSTEARPNRFMLFYAVGGKELAVLSPTTQASGEMNVSVVEASFDEEVFAATPGDDGDIFVLGSNSVYRVKEDSGKQEQKISLTPKTAVKHATLDFHTNAQLLLVPAKNQHLDLISTKTNLSVLKKVWEPHTDAAPTFAHFFTTHDFDEEEKDSILLVTAARNNTELRFWSFNRITQRFNLKQEITIVDEDDAEDEFDLSITPSEEYITLASRKRAFAVVVEMNRTQLMAHRLTTWKMPAPSLCCTTYVGKVAESALSKSVHYELFVMLRTTDSFTQSMLDANKLVGGSNLASIRGGAASGTLPASAANASGGNGAAAGAAGTAAVNSVANWFPGAANNAGGAATAVTSVSSSLLGDIKSSNAIPASMAAKVVQVQTQKFCEQVRLLDNDFVMAQKHATETMRMLQDPKYREEAQSNGRRFAMRNRQRLQQGPSAGKGGAADGPAEAGMMTESQRELILSITNFVKEVEGGSEAAASAALKALLQKQLKSSVDRASAEMEQLDVTGSIAMNINSTDAARQFKNVVDASARQMLASVREFLQLTRTTLDTSTAETNAAVQRARDFSNAVREASTQVRTELTDVKATIDAMQSAVGDGAAAAVDPNVLVNRAIAKAEAADWAGAFAVALEASDITVLLAFLESKVCADNEKTLTLPETLSLPHFLSLCLQLTFELSAQPGAVPLRIQQLHRFFVEWDDTLRNMKKDSRHASSFEIVRRELTTVLRYLNEVEPNTLDRKTRNNFRLVSKLMTALLSDE